MRPPASNMMASTLLELQASSVPWMIEGCPSPFPSQARLVSLHAAMMVLYGIVQGDFSWKAAIGGSTT